MAHFMTRATVAFALLVHALHGGGTDHLPHPAHMPVGHRPHAMRMVGAKV